MLTYDCAYEDIQEQDRPPRGGVCLTKEGGAFDEYHISKILSDNPDVDPEHIAVFRSRFYAIVAAEAIERECKTRS